MATWDLRRLQQFLEKHPPGSLYLLFGEETYLTDEALSLIKEKSLSEGAVDFNFDQFYYPEAKPAQVRDVAETLPVMCPRRVVVYKGVHLLKDKDWEQLLPLLENPNESTTLILVGEKADKRKKPIKRIIENGTAVETKRPYDNQLPAWIEYIGFQHDLELSSEAVVTIQQMVGANLSEVNSEVQKLKQYLGDQTKADVKDVLKVISHAKIDSIFDLTEAIGRRDRAAALTSLVRLLESGQNEVGALLLIARHVRILSSIKQGLKQGLSGARLSAKVGVPNFFLKQYQAQSQAWREDKLDSTIEALHKTDKALKSSPVSSHIWLENFIVQSCSS